MGFFEKVAMGDACRGSSLRTRTLGPTRSARVISMSTVMWCAFLSTASGQARQTVTIRVGGGASPPTQLFAAMSACRLGQYDRALDVLDGLMELEGGTFSNAQWAEAYLAAGYAYDRKGERGQAIENYSLAAAFASPESAVAQWAEKGLVAPLTQTPFGTSGRTGRHAGWFPFRQRPETAFANLDDEARRRLADENLRTLGAAPDGETRWKAIEALGLLRDRRAVPRLLQFLDRRGRAMGFRQSWVAAKALGRIGDPATVPALIDALASINPDTRREALNALRRITGQHLTTQQQWRRWLADNQPQRQ